MRPVTRGFTVDIFPEFEREKADRAEAKKGKVVATEKPLWEADDTRWLVPFPYEFKPFVVRFAGRCVYCGGPIPEGANALYAWKVKSVAHVECHG